MASNSAFLSAGGLFGCNGTIGNCVIWGNAAPQGPQLYGCSVPNYSCIQSSAGGGDGNTDGDPSFVDSDGPDNDPLTYEDNDYHLSPDSPCIDAGRNDEWMWESTDLDGNSRVVQGTSSLTVDMGAYEYRSWRFEITGLVPLAGGNFQLKWGSRQGDMYTAIGRQLISGGLNGFKRRPYRRKGK